MNHPTSTGARPVTGKLHWRGRLQLAAFHAAARWMLARFKLRLRHAPALNTQALRDTLKRNAGSVYGVKHDFQRLLAASDLVAAFQAQVSLSTYGDYEPYITRIASGETNVLTRDPVHMLAGSAGTTGRPKRIPRTRRAQRHHMALVVLAGQAVVDQGVPGARLPYRGISLMSFYAPPAPETGRIPVMAGPNAGIARVRRYIPVLWCAPEPVYGVADPVAAFYLHALFALRDADALYIETPFASQVAGWLGLIQSRQAELLRDLQLGTVTTELPLTDDERHALQPHLHADPARAAAVAAAFAHGFQSIVPRLWPNLRYISTVTSGSFALSLPRLRWYCGPTLPIYSVCHSSSEGVIGLNLQVDGSTNYVLAIGTAFFEFIALLDADTVQPPTVPLRDLIVGAEYEIVLTSSAGLYRYRLGDVIRVTGWHASAPTFQFLYRRGTVLNLIGEKTSEFHTAQAICAAMSEWLDQPDAVHEYTVTGCLEKDVGRYTFYVELSSLATAQRACIAEGEALLDASLCAINPYYRSSGREPGRLGPPTLKVVRAGTFASLLELQRHYAAPAAATQIKIPRVVTRPEQLALLEAQVVTGRPDGP